MAIKINISPSLSGSGACRLYIYAGTTDLTPGGYHLDNTANIHYATPNSFVDGSSTAVPLTWQLNSCSGTITGVTVEADFINVS